MRGENFEKIINRHVYFPDSISGMSCGCMGSRKRWDRIWCAGVALYPFAGLLLCVAVMPLVKGEWWESHQPVVVAFWIVLMIIPFAVVYGAGKLRKQYLSA